MTKSKEVMYMQDGMLFGPYMDDGFRSIILCSAGKLSVRFQGRSLFTDRMHPYEVWYPTESEPLGYQTVEDIFNYLKKVQNGNSRIHSK